MIAVILSGGKQYKVQENELVDVEKLSGAVGDKISLKPLLVIDGDKTFATEKELANFAVEAEIAGEGKKDKIFVFKYKAKKNERKRQGHRQPFTTIKIVSIKKI